MILINLSSSDQAGCAVLACLCCWRCVLVARFASLMMPRAASYSYSCSVPTRPRLVSATGTSDKSRAGFIEKIIHDVSEIIVAPPVRSLYMCPCNYTEWINCVVLEADAKICPSLSIALCLFGSHDRQTHTCLH